MNDTKTLSPSEDISAEIKAAEMEIDETINTANQRLADVIKEQEVLFNENYSQVKSMLQKNGERLDEIQQRIDENWKQIAKLEEAINKNSEILREKAKFH